ITLLDQGGSAPAGSFGDDYLAGGAGGDMIFGELGDDVIQGDGSIDYASPGGAAGIGTRVGVSRDATGALLVNPSFDAPTDGDDYVEGGGGADVIFGNQGQDDLIGGSSSLFTLTAQALRPDGDDIIFGGAGTRVGRNDPGDAAATGHARDADVILGDNGNI